MKSYIFSETRPLHPKRKAILQQKPNILVNKKLCKWERYIFTVLFEQHNKQWMDTYIGKS